MKSKLLLLLLIITKTCTPQKSQLSDVFPLEIGNEWNYQFFYNVSISHSGTHDDGIIDFTVTGKILSKDSICWQLFQRRSYNHTDYIHGQASNSYSGKDSNSIEIIEFNFGNHELYTPVYDPLSVFPFQNLMNDTSSRFFRYAEVDSNGNSQCTLSFPNVKDPYLSYNCGFTLTKDTGIVLASCYQNLDHEIGFMYSNYQLQYFHSSQSQTSIATSLSTFPKQFILYQNFPNPFNPTTTIKYYLPINYYVTLNIYNIFGEKVVTLVNGLQSAGEHSVIFDGRKLSSGVYLYQLISGNFKQIRKLVLLK